MKAIIFDMDGVLVNTEPLHYECWKAALADEGIEMSYEVYKPCIGSTVGYLMELLRAAYGENISDVETLRARMYAKKEEIVQRDGFPQIPGVKEAVKRFHEEGLRLEVASSSAGYYIGRVLDALEIRQYFETYTSGEEVEHPKPAPDTFLRAMEKLNLKPEDCLIVEDSTNGGKAAAAAGAKCVWFHNPDSGEQSIPHAALEITSWSPEEVEKIIQLIRDHKSISDRL